MSLLILVVDDEPDVEALFRQRFRRDLRSGRFTMGFAQSADSALQRISDAAGASLIGVNLVSFKSATRALELSREPTIACRWSGKNPTVSTVNGNERGASILELPAIPAMGRIVRLSASNKKPSVGA